MTTNQMLRRFWIILSSFVWALKIQLKTNNPTPQRNQTNRTQWKEEQEKNKKVWPSDALGQVLDNGTD